QGWPMVGFILMIDDFTHENGATCFALGSQGMEALPASFSLVQACGPAGSVIVFNGSVWHGHCPNLTDTPIRSLQGAYIRRTEISGETLLARTRPETLVRIGARQISLDNMNLPRSVQEGLRRGHELRGMSLHRRMLIGNPNAFRRA